MVGVTLTGEIQAEVVEAIAAIRACEAALADAEEAADLAKRAETRAADDLGRAKRKLHRLLYLP